MAITLLKNKPLRQNEIPAQIKTTDKADKTMEEEGEREEVEEREERE